MPTPKELEQKFWQALKSDMTMMLGLDGVEDGHTRPMTAQVESDRPPIWFFTAKDTDIAKKLGSGHRAIATFASKDHELFATVHGRLVRDNDRAVIDRLWNRFIAAWFEGGWSSTMTQAHSTSMAAGQRTRRRRCDARCGCRTRDKGPQSLTSIEQLPRV